MSKDLYYTIPEYFKDRMNNHSNVSSIIDVSNSDFFLYRIKRKRYNEMLVWLSDAYRFTDMDYHNMPSELRPGDYVLIAKPEGGFKVTPELITNARVGVGQIGKLMGALTSRFPWEYLTPWEREALKRSHS